MVRALDEALRETLRQGAIGAAAGNACSGSPPMFRCRCHAANSTFDEPWCLMCDGAYVDLCTWCMTGE